MALIDPSPLASKRIILTYLLLDNAFIYKHKGLFNLWISFISWARDDQVVQWC